MTTPNWRRGWRAAVVTAAAALAALVTAGAAEAAVDLAPASASHLVGQTATLTTTATTVAGGPAAFEPVTFTVNSGPNAGLTGSSTTDANGKASFSYSSTKTGTDHITALVLRLQQTSNDATVTWSLPPKTDVGVSITPPFVVRVGQNGTWKAAVTNAGPDTATGVIFSATAPAGAALVSATESGGNSCTGSTCPVGTLGAGASATITLVYALSQLGAVTLTATVQSDFDTNTSNNTSSGTTTVLQIGAPPPPPPPPSQPGTFNAIGTGTVLVNGVVRPADQVFQLNSGDTVDVTNGVMTFTAADGSSGSFSSSRPTARRSTAAAVRVAANLPAQFTATQPASGGVTTLTLVGADFSSCGSPRSLAASKKPIRQLWGSGKGTFRTTGRYAAATVRGTIWLVQDRCDGTLTQVVEGVVSVFDSARNKTVSVSAGGSYLAAPRAPLIVPAQTPAQVVKRGLLYRGHVYKTAKAFEQYLRRAGHTMAEFARKYPKLAAALAKRK